MRIDQTVLTQTGDLVRVRDTWNGWHTAEVSRNELHDVRWVRPQGAPQPILHACVRCEALERRVPHEWGAQDGAHDVRVCVLKNDVTTSLYEVLAAAAGGPSSRR